MAALTRDDAILANIGLVRRIARDFRHCRLDREDLIQEGMVGLIRAVDLYDPDLGIPFGRFARIWIKSYMGRAARIELTAVAVCTSIDLDSLAARTEGDGPHIEEVWSAIESLPHWDQQVMIRLFGLAGATREGRGLTASRFDTTEKHMRKVKRRSMRAMRSQLTA